MQKILTIPAFIPTAVADVVFGEQAPASAGGPFLFTEEATDAEINRAIALIQEAAGLVEKEGALRVKALQDFLALRSSGPERGHLRLLKGNGGQ